MFKWKNILLFILLTIFAFVSGAWYRFVNIPIPPASAGSQLYSNGTEQSEDDIILDIAGRINVLIVGEDDVQGSRRSDTILVATIDVDNENIRVLSIPRDTRVLIPRYGNQKINHAYAYGGSELVRETMQRFLGIPISYYIKIDYDNFPKLVDLLGGVDIFVGRAMRYRDVRGNLDINIPAGKQRMNGETALKYVRFRMDNLGDIGRIQRQQQFMKAMIQRMYEPENFMRFNTIIREVQKTVITDMNPSMILQLGYFARKLDKQTDRMFFMMLPGTVAMIDKLSYWVSDRNDAMPFLTANLDELKEMTTAARNQLIAVTQADDYSADHPDGRRPPGERSEQNVNSEGGGNAQVSNSQEDIKPNISQIIASMPEAVAVLNGNGRRGIGESVATHLQKMGVEVVHTGNAKHFDYRSSNIIYPARPTDNNRLAATLLAQLCGISSSLTVSNSQATYPSLIVGHDYESLIRRLENSHAQLQ